MNHLRVNPTPLPVSEVESCLVAFQAELDYIHRTLRRLGTAPFEVDDMAQEVFLAMKSSWKRYDATRPLRPYLFGIAFRVVAASQRKRRREIPRSFIDAIDESGTPDEIMQAKQARATVLAALEKVPLPRRAVLVMHDIDETPVAEIAETLSIPLFTAYSRLRKARAELNSALRRMLREVGDR